MVVICIFLKAFQIDHLKDHLGNVRVAFFDNDTIVQRNDYYPFGMSIAENSYQKLAGNYKNTYLYNGKELQTDLDLDWHDYGARFYDAEVGRWWSIDPLAEYYADASPYAYVNSNPISFMDPNGMFRTRFGAAWHKFWNGGDGIGHHKDGEYFVYSGNNSVADDGTVTVTSSRVFDRNGRNYGRNYEGIENYEFNANIQEKINEGIYRSAESRLDAISSHFQVAALPSVIAKGTSVVNAASKSKSVNQTNNVVVKASNQVVIQTVSKGSKVTTVNNTVKVVGDNNIVVQNVTAGNVNINTVSTTASQIIKRLNVTTSSSVKTVTNNVIIKGNNNVVIQNSTYKELKINGKTLK